MRSKKPYILQISAGATHGGASGIALNLFEELGKRGYPTKIATSCHHPDKKNFLYIPRNNYNNFLCRHTKKFIGKVKGAGLFTNFLYNLSRPSCLLKNLRGVENFENYPGTRDFFKNLQPFPDIIHAHNLHGRYFDLRMLSQLSSKVPLFITLHDEWMFTGHCACTLGCTKWKSGCGSCPNLSVYDPLRRDTTRYNLKQKEKIYKNSQLHIVTPSQWLMNKAKQSILAAGIKTSKVIHNGIDLALFKPKKSPQNNTLLFVANQIKTNPFKDYKTLEKALFWISENQKFTEPIKLICLGDTGHTIRKNNLKIIFINYIQNKNKLITYYQTADILIHATNSDNFPTTILEALACGLPVIGTNIGGIPEQITKKTGLLYEHKNYLDLAQKIIFLLQNKTLRITMSQNAIIDAHNRFDQQKQITKQINYYQEQLCQKQKSPSSSAPTIDTTF